MPWKKFVSAFFAIFIVATLLFTTTPRVFSDELDDITKQINELNDSLNKSINATKPLESQLNAMEEQISGIKYRVGSIAEALPAKQKEIDEGYKKMSGAQEEISATIRKSYIKSYYDSPLLAFFSGDNASDITLNLAYQKTRTQQERDKLTNFALLITDLENKKVELENEKRWLIATKSSLDEQSEKLNKVVKGAQEYQAQLSSKIAQLSAQQQEFISKKQGSLNLPKSAYSMSGGCSSDLNNGKDPGFGPKFGLFSFGVPHRVGMSQYGAKGRAESGDTYEKILSFYFPNTSIQDTDPNFIIKVVGKSEYNEDFYGNDNWTIEEYVKHLYEMPSNWHMEALKAQAIAARSYALATKTTINGTPDAVCPTQYCQVVKKDINSERWQQAVRETSGKILTNGGSPIQAWFSSTAGGYTFGSGDVWGGSNKPWTRNSLDASVGSVGSFSDLISNAYDKESPWLYCDWGGRSQYGGTAWLKGEELADIVNVILLARADSGSRDHLYQTDKPNPAGTETWNQDKVKQELRTRHITPFNNINGGSASADFGSGRTTSVKLQGDAGTFEASGQEFKDFFNLRAPANINIVSYLYNIEVR